MRTNTMRTVIVGLMAVALIALGATAFAGKGMGRQGDDQGYGYHRSCGDMNPNLTAEQREQLDSQRQAFFEATKATRQDLYAKQLELRAEMAKQEPDMQKASALQKAVSELRGDLDQQHLNHVMAMRKIDPDAGRGFMMHGREMGGYHGMGHGMGYGHGACRQWRE